MVPLKTLLDSFDKAMPPSGSKGLLRKLATFSVSRTCCKTKIYLANACLWVVAPCRQVFSYTYFHTTLETCSGYISYSAIRMCSQGDISVSDQRFFQSTLTFFLFQSFTVPKEMFRTLSGWLLHSGLPASRQGLECSWNHIQSLDDRAQIPGRKWQLQSSNSVGGALLLSTLLFLGSHP
ncbi:UNVERIFIED_CONTAM: hypothetical protein K2H54_033869 [Gekko kuhli]